MDSIDIVLSDLEGAQSFGSPVKEVMSTPQYMPLSVVSLYIQGHVNGGKQANSLLRSVTPVVWDAAVDYWSFGVMVLQRYCPEFFKRFQVREEIRKADRAFLQVR
jgi:hypothetical protein